MEGARKKQQGFLFKEAVMWQRERERAEQKSRCLLQRQTDMLRMIKNRVYDRVREMRECLNARTRSMTMKKRAMREKEGEKDSDGRRKTGMQY